MLIRGFIIFSIHIMSLKLQQIIRNIVLLIFICTFSCSGIEKQIIKVITYIQSTEQVSTLGGSKVRRDHGVESG